MRQGKGERASECHQNKIDVGSMEACLFYEIWIALQPIKSVGGSSSVLVEPPLEFGARGANISVRNTGVLPA